MKAVKKILPFLMLVIIIIISARFAVFSGYLHSQKKELRKTTLVQKNLQVKKILFNEEQLFVDQGTYQWKEHNKELVIDGCYHEVLSILKINKGFIVAVIEDKIENELLKHFFENNKSAQDTASSLLQLLQLQYPVPDALVLNAPSIQNYKYNLAPKPMLCLGFDSTLLLPPRVC